MSEKFPEKAKEIMNERFNHDSLIALATTDGNMPKKTILKCKTMLQ